MRWNGEEGKENVENFRAMPSTAMNSYEERGRRGPRRAVLRDVLPDESVLILRTVQADSTRSMGRLARSGRSLPVGGAAVVAFYQQEPAVGGGLGRDVAPRHPTVARTTCLKAAKNLSYPRGWSSS